MRKVEMCIYMNTHIYTGSSRPCVYLSIFIYEYEYMGERAMLEQKNEMTP